MIRGNYIQLSQVFINLVTNVIDAIEENKDKWVRIESRYINEVVEIKFIDSGLGIEPKIFDKIFEPFYTTKEVGKGTGI